MTRVAVIPARGGSKRVPRKNIRLFHGRPMLVWSIDAAARSGVFDRVVVSTDSEEIAAVAREAGAEVPFQRPVALADDHATALDVMRHAAEEIADASALACIYATAPFVNPTDIARALAALEADPTVAYVFGLTSYPAPIQRALRVLSSGGIAMFQPEHRLTRSQDLDEAFHDAGQFCWGRAEAWRRGEPIFSDTSRAVLIPRWRVQDIDTEEDWERAERMFLPPRDPLPGGYSVMPRPGVSAGEYRIEAVAPGDIESIRQWRNEQIDALRQAAPISRQEQIDYFARVIWPDMASTTPAQVLVTFWRANERIGYGGLVHIDWHNRHAEVSFLLRTELSRDHGKYSDLLCRFFELIRELAFDDLGLHRIHTMSWDVRDHHIKAIEDAGMRREGVLAEHARVGDGYADAILHAYVSTE